MTLPVTLLPTTGGPAGGHVGAGTSLVAVATNAMLVARTTDDLRRRSAGPKEDRDG